MAWADVIKERFPNASDELISLILWEKESEEEQLQECNEELN